MYWLNDLKKYGLMLHVIYNPVLNWLGIEFIHKILPRKCVVYSDSIPESEFINLYRAFREVELFYGVDAKDSPYACVQEKLTECDFN